MSAFLLPRTDPAQAPMPLILIRADASPAKGTGHVMRCLALAEALRAQGARAAFACMEITPALAGRLRDEGIDLHLLDGDDATATLALGNRLDAAALVVDSYWLDAGWRRTVRPGFRAVLALDDLADTDLHADMVWNPASRAADLPYDRRAPGAGRLFGPAFLLLRAEIRRAANASRPPPDQRDTILLTFGGSDPAGLTVPVVKRLAPALPPGVRLEVVAGGSNPALDCVTAACARHAGRIALHVDSRRIGALMAGCGLAITAGGGTVAELAALATPCLLAIVADNQAPAGEDARARGWAAVIDGRGDRAAAADAIATMALSLWADPARRLDLSRRITMDGIDGLGADRVAAALLARLAAGPARTGQN
ncbi:UDP-2,4-diacetamido-2,4,6-trideoxy-beta-L-altropyranose hydrolase [Niveispirillum fermenti]|uniref:UDP-2,4-diacetamido-2,4, 6-trideoxy-beta-L-altropyranose hydrolase n=1 Tax=Niveispirillum fermenti TaxID=1233113 RepID=UPI003A8A45EE